VADQTPPTLHGPSDKERKYDRQLRLWAASGQAALESSHVLLINSGGGTVGVEALKNLVLPGQFPLPELRGQAVCPLQSLQRTVTYHRSSRRDWEIHNHGR